MGNALRLDHEQPASVLHRADDYILRHHAFIDERPAERRASLHAAAATTLALWRRRYLTRRHLAALDAHGLTDIGLDPHAREREVGKHFWQA